MQRNLSEEFEGHILDWSPRFDTRSLDYKIEDTFATTKTPKIRNWRRSIFLDQGREGACVGFAHAHAYHETPRPRTKGVSNAFASNWYKEAQKRDQWPGENYAGSSCLGGAKAGKDLGYYTEYYWATTLAEIITGVGYLGPMAIGVPWYEGMTRTDGNGRIQATGRQIGGHAVVIGGVDPKNRYFRIDNSWGKSWGVNGHAFLSFEDVDKLLHEHSEFCLPRKPLSKG